MNVRLTKDMPERGRRWVAGLIIYGIDKEYFKKELEEGIMVSIDEVEPTWKLKNDVEE